MTEYLHAANGHALSCCPSRTMASEWQDPNPLCDCGIRAVHRTVSKATKNCGRSFFVCPKENRPDKEHYDPTHCKFFKWEDEMPNNDATVPLKKRRMQEPTGGIDPDLYARLAVLEASAGKQAEINAKLEEAYDLVQEQLVRNAEELAKMKQCLTPEPRSYVGAS